MPQTGSIAPFGFTGELQDSAGYVYLRARWYTPANGTFISRDSFTGYGFQPYSLHQYQYGFSNPILYTDPTGQHPCLAALVAGPPGAVVSTGCIIIVTVVALALGASAYIVERCIHRQQCNDLQNFLREQGDKVTATYENVTTYAPIGARYVGEQVSQACSAAIEGIVAFAKGGKQKNESYVTQWAKEEAKLSEKDVCTVLREAREAAAAAGDSKLRADIITAEKILG